MVTLTVHDSGALSRLAGFSRLPPEKRQAILDEVQAEDARQVGEVLLHPEKYETASPEVKATVDRFNAWLEVNRRLSRQREIRRRTADAQREAEHALKL
jgi:hypothetical protein